MPTPHPLFLNSGLPVPLPYSNTSQLLTITLSSKYRQAWRETAEDPPILSLPRNFIVKRFIKKLCNMAVLGVHLPF